MTKIIKLKPKIKTPILFYGSKWRMVKHLLRQIPKHITYAEVFAGGAVLFWAKEPAKVEIINDKNGELINFYAVLKSNYRRLNSFIQQTVHSRRTHKCAKAIYECPTFFTKLQRAWAFWCLSSQSFGGVIGNSWRYDKKIKSSTSTAVRNKKIRFNEELTNRIDRVTIENTDALDVIYRYDTEDTFFYADPPYINTNQGHYSGYNEQHYTELLTALSQVKGKFLLSSFPSNILDKFVLDNDWSQIRIQQTGSMNSKVKIEVMTANYPLVGESFTNEVRKAA